MRFLQFATLLPLFLCALLPASAQPQEWHIFTSEKLGFSAHFPDIPTERSQQVKETGETVHLIMAGDGFGSDPVNYIVQYVELLPGTAHSDDTSTVQAYFDGLINQMTDGNAELVLSQTAIEKNGFPGRKYLISVLDGVMLGIQESYLVQNKVYSLIVMTGFEHKDNELIHRFFDSFTLLK